MDLLKEVMQRRKLLNEMSKKAEKKKHIHKYKRVDIGRKEPYFVFRCFDSDGCPNPNHYLPPTLVVGRKTICWRCNEERVMTEDMAKKVKPTCYFCRGGIDDSVLDDLLLLDGLKKER